MTQDDIGVPEALPRALEQLKERLGVAALDRLWIFPPMRRGRRERGLIAVSAFQEGEERRSLVTVAYVAEQTGKEGVKVETAFTREGEAPADRFPTVMKGVVMRGGEERGEPREVEIGGSGEALEGLLEELGLTATGVPES
ncbi:MAG TPA: hypothetical protein VMM35_12385 [Longimicrobiales bacterium]|nr:hypothetical protein [Longimicrobiales bacterium]